MYSFVYGLFNDNINNSGQIASNYEWTVDFKECGSGSYYTRTYSDWAEPQQMLTRVAPVPAKIQTGQSWIQARTHLTQLLICQWIKKFSVVISSHW